MQRTSEVPRPLLLSGSIRNLEVKLTNLTRVARRKCHQTVESLLLGRLTKSQCLYKEVSSRLATLDGGARL